MSKVGWDVTVLEGSGFGIPDLASDGVVDAARVARWSEKFGHLAAMPALRYVIATAWAAWEMASALGRFDVVEVTEFGLLHLPHALQPLAPTVVQCHVGWGQMSLYERTEGDEIDPVIRVFGRIQLGRVCARSPWPLHMLMICPLSIGMVGMLRSMVAAALQIWRCGKNFPESGADVFYRNRRLLLFKLRTFRPVLC